MKIMKTYCCYRKILTATSCAQRILELFSVTYRISDRLQATLPRSNFSILGKGKVFFLLLNVRNGVVTHPVPNSFDNGRAFSYGRAAGT